jgi:imidazolonepropionase-like amidohydrolase
MEIYLMGNKSRKSYKQTCSVGLIIALGWFGATIQAQSPLVENVLLEHVRVIVGDGSVIPDAAVLLQDDTIVAVGASAEFEIPTNTRRVDLTGKTLMPTMVDAHAHLGYEAFNSWGAQNYTVENLVDHLNRYAYYGFSAVFSAGSDPDTLALQLQNSQQNGATGGARFLFAAGMAPPGQGPNNQFLVETIMVEQNTGDTILRGLASPDQARIAVNEVADLQIPFIKLWVDDRGGSQEKLKPDVYRAAISEANRLGMAAVVHQQYAKDMPDLIAAGTRGFLHGRLEEGFTKEIAEAASANNVFIVPNLGLGELRREAIGEDQFLAQTLPTSAIQRLSASTQRKLTPDSDPQLEQTLRNSFSSMMAANVDVVLGTDAGAVPDHPFGYTGHRELEIFVKYGMSPMQALSAATSVAARVLGLADAGLIKAGYRADLLILDRNPLEDIRNTRQIHAVYLGGKRLDREALAAEFKSGGN